MCLFFCGFQKLYVVKFYTIYKCIYCNKTLAWTADLQNTKITQILLVQMCGVWWFGYVVCCKCVVCECECVVVYGCALWVCVCVVSACVVSGGGLGERVVPVVLCMRYVKTRIYVSFYLFYYLLYCCFYLVFWCRCIAASAIVFAIVAIAATLLLHCCCYCILSHNINFLIFCEYKITLQKFISQDCR